MRMVREKGELGREEGEVAGGVVQEGSWGGGARVEEEGEEEGEEQGEVESVAEREGAGVARARMRARGELPPLRPKILVEELRLSIEEEEEEGMVVETREGNPPE